MSSISCHIFQATKIPSQKRSLSSVAKLPPEITSPFQEFVPIGRTVAAEIYKKRTPANLSGELDFLATLAAFDGNVEAYGILAAWYSGEISCPHCDDPISLDDISPY